MQKFFDNRNLIVLIDSLCKKYGKLPHEVLSELTVNDFCLNIAIMIVANIEETKGSEKKDTVTNWNALGIERTVIDNRKKEK